MTTIMAYDRWGGQTGTVDCLSAEHSETINGEDSLTLETFDELQKGMRLVWCDVRGVWHEHVVDEVEKTHDSAGRPVSKVTCLNSIVETYGDYVDDKRPSGVAASSALGTLLAYTRWSVGTCDQSGTASHTFYHESVREAIQELVETWGGELETTIVVSGASVTSRKVGIRAARGSQTSTKRFTWTKDLTSVKRTVCSDEVYSAVIPYGKGVETDTGGYGRRLDISTVNGGSKILSSAAARTLWGRPDASGNKVDTYKVVVHEECDVASDLLKLGKADLEEYTTPKLSYELGTVDLAQCGLTHEGVSIGDRVAIIDKGFEPEVRAQGRVTKVVRDLMTSESTVTIGNVVEGLDSIYGAQQAAISSLSGRSSSWDVAASTPTTYLQQVVDGLNAAFDATGTYIAFDFDQGLTCSNVPLVNGKPTKTPASAINIRGGGFRIANTLTSDGGFNWRTFGTGSGFTADEINAGTINASLIKTGIAQGLNLVINFDTGEVTFQKGSITSSNGKLNISVDDGTFASTNSSNEGVFFRDGELHLTKRSDWAAGSDPDYGRLKRDNGIWSNSGNGMTVEGEDGLLLRTSSSAPSWGVSENFPHTSGAELSMDDSDGDTALCAAGKLTIRGGKTYAGILGTAQSVIEMSSDSPVIDIMSKQIDLTAYDSSKTGGRGRIDLTGIVNITGSLYVNGVKKF